jgi:hypothetical protein
MPKYYFDVDGLPPDMDSVGDELKNDDVAWEEATQYAGQLLKDVDGKLPPGQEWRLIVSDADRNQLFVIHVKSQKTK